MNDKDVDNSLTTLRGHVVQDCSCEHHNHPDPIARGARPIFGARQRKIDRQTVRSHPDNTLNIIARGHGVARDNQSSVWCYSPPNFPDPLNPIYAAAWPENLENNLGNAYVRASQLCYIMYWSLFRIFMAPPASRPGLWHEQMGGSYTNLSWAFGPFDHGRLSLMMPIASAAIGRFLHGFPVHVHILHTHKPPLFVFKENASWLCSFEAKNILARHHSYGDIEICESLISSHEKFSRIIYHEYLHHLFFMDDQIYNGVKAYEDIGPLKFAAKGQYLKALSNIDNWTMLANRRLIFLEEGGCSLPPVDPPPPMPPPQPPSPQPTVPMLDLPLISEPFQDDLPPGWND